MVRNILLDPEDCTGCGACAELSPGVFEMNEAMGVAQVVNPGGDDPASIEEAIEICPCNCIRWEDFDE